jgi:hypothetical protein
MKKILTIGTMLVLLVISFGASAKNMDPQGVLERNNICSNILGGTLVTLTGTVISIGNQDGLVVDTTEQGVVTIYGIGPEWYWKKKGIDRPDIGDSVIVIAYTVTFSDGIRYVASSITIGDKTIGLRDSETGCPLWRGGRRQ